MGSSSVAVDLAKKSLIVITGASKGIGQCLAVELAKRINNNSIFVLFARSNAGLEETKQKIEKIHNSFTVLNFSVDLYKPDLNTFTEIFSQVSAKIKPSVLQFGYIFHNAGHVGTLKPTTELSDLQNWREYYDLNLFSTILLNNAFLQTFAHVIAQFVVINVTSLVGRTPYKNFSMYGSGKAARELFFKVLALEEPKLTILNYSPGPVLTDMFNSICETAQDEETRKNFKDLQKTTALKPEETVTKLLNILEKGEYSSGATIDYFDRI